MLKGANERVCFRCQFKLTLRGRWLESNYSRVVSVWTSNSQGRPVIAEYTGNKTSYTSGKCVSCFNVVGSFDKVRVLQGARGTPSSLFTEYILRVTFMKKKLIDVDMTITGIYHSEYVIYHLHFLAESEMKRKKISANI